MNARSDVLVVVVGFELSITGWRQMIAMDGLVCTYGANRTDRWVDDGAVS